MFRRLPAGDCYAANEGETLVYYLAMLAGLFIAGALTHASSYGANHDVFRADRVWLYAVILTVGYMISRGFAKSGSRDPYTEER